MFYQFAGEFGIDPGCMVTVPDAAGLFTRRRPPRTLTDVLADGSHPPAAGFAAADDFLAMY